MKKIDYWTTRDGEDILVKNMESSHIINTLRYFNDSIVSDSRAEMLEAVIEEARRRGINAKCDYSLESYFSEFGSGEDWWKDLDF